MLSQGAAENRNNEICHIIYILHMCMCVQRWVAQSCLTLCDPVDCSLPGSSVRGDSPGKNTGAGCHAPLQGIFPTQRSNPGLPHCRRILYRLNHQGSPRILEWVAYSFPRGSSWPRNWTRISCIAGGCFILPAELSRKLPGELIYIYV